MMHCECHHNLTRIQDFSVNEYQPCTNIIFDSTILILPHDGGGLRFTKYWVLVCGGFVLCDVGVCGRIRIHSSGIESHIQDGLAVDRGVDHFQSNWDVHKSKLCPTRTMTRAMEEVVCLLRVTS